MSIKKRLTFIVLCLLLVPVSGLTQAPDGELLFQTHCAACHQADSNGNVPALDELSAYDPNAVFLALTDGVMRLQGESLSDVQRSAITQFITGRDINRQPLDYSTGLCEANPVPAYTADLPRWSGWSDDPRNTRFLETAGGLQASDVVRLRLKWAFGIPGVTQSRSQPAVFGGYLYLGSQNGMVYALDAATGCTYWSFLADGGVRTAISVGAYTDERFAVYFSDARANAYAVDAQSGRLIWKRKLDEHPSARATGAPTLFNGVLFAPLSGVSEENIASRPDYECCTFRGSVSALNAYTGEVIWKTYTVDEPVPRGKSDTGAQLWGPAGVAIWSAPTIDAERGLLYVTTGNGYADPQPDTSDAVIAMDLETGSIKWTNQIMPDTWVMGCDVQSSGGNPNAGDNPNCPDDVGPDFDFSASAILARKTDGMDVIIVTQKSGIGYALDPDDNGRILWEYRWGQGSPIGGVWGSAVDRRNAFFAVADIVSPTPGGLHAVDLETGLRNWYHAPAAPLCGSGRGCTAVQAAALTTIPGVVFAGSHDGGLRAHSATTGEIIWQYDTNREFDTINGIKARGGSIDGPGPVAAGKMLYVTSGNGGMFGLPGNVLLAFEPAD